MSKRYTSLDQIPPRPSQVLWITFVLILILLPHSVHLPPTIFVISFSLMLIAAWFSRKNRFLPRLIRIGLVLLGLIAVLFQFGTITGRDAGVSLLSIMLALKLLEVRTLRDASIAIFLGYFLIITQFLFSQAMPLIFYLFGAALLMTSVLINLSDTSRSSTTGDRLKRSARLLLQSLPFMLILFVLFPRIHAPLWGFSSQQSTAVSGLDDSMSPGQFTDLIQSNRLAFRATFEDRIPRPEERYWRGPVLWDFDGQRWKGRPGQSAAAPPLLEGQNEPLHYRLLMEPSNRPWVLGLDITTSHPPGLRMTSDYQLIAPGPIREFTEYRLTAYTSYRAGMGLSPEERDRALKLPDGSSPRALALGQQWKKLGLDGKAVAARALSMIRNENFSYTLSPPLYLQDPVDEFLFEGRRGFCEHYAGAFVFLMRAAGVPARVVTGYLGGEVNPAGGYLMVRQSDAHAWTEIWLDELGWIRVDPTAAIAPERIESGLGNAISDPGNLPLAIQGRYSESLLHHLSLFYDSADYYWNFWILGFGPERQKELAQKLGLGKVDWQELILLILVSFAGIILLYLLTYLIRKPKTQIDENLRAFILFRSKLQQLGVHSSPQTGPVELLEQIEHTHKELAPDARDIIVAYIGLRYADRHVDTTLSALLKMVRNFSKRNPPKRVN